MRILVVFALTLASCSKPVTPMDACHKLETAGVASNCHEGKPHGLAADANADIEFDLPSVPGHGGAVFGFDSDEHYDSTVKSFDDAKVIAGPHRYGNKKKRIFVQFNDGASMATGKTAKDVIDGL